MSDYMMDKTKLVYHPKKLVEYMDYRMGIKMVMPMWFEISPTSSCHSNCIFCGYSKIRKPGAFLDLRAIHILKSMARSGVKAFVFSGDGEPLLNRHLFQLIYAIAEEKSEVALATSGVPVAKGDWLKMIPFLTWLRFSVDAGNDPTYQAVHRPKKHSLPDVVESVKIAADTKMECAYKCTIGVQFILLDENVESLPEFLRLFSDIPGIDYLSIKAYSYNETGCEKDLNVDYSCLIDQARAMIEDYWKARFTAGGTTPKVIFRGESMIKADQVKKFESCFAGSFMGYMDADCNIYSCPVGDKFPIGNARLNDYSILMQNAIRQNNLEIMDMPCSIENCRVNCRGAGINEFMENWFNKRPDHLNFI